MELKFENDGFIGGGVKANNEAKTYDEFVRFERDRLFPDKTEKEQKIKEKLFEAFRNEKPVRIFEHDGFKVKTVLGHIDYDNNVNVYKGYVFDCLLGFDGSDLVVIKDYTRKEKVLLKICDIGDVTFLSEEEVQKEGIGMVDFDNEFFDAYKVEPHNIEGFSIYKQDLHKVGVRIAVPMDYEELNEIEDACFVEFSGQFYDMMFNEASSIKYAMCQPLLNIHHAYYTKEELEENKGMKLVTGLVDIDKLQTLMGRLTVDLDEVKHQVVELEDYTHTIKKILVDALTEENYKLECEKRNVLVVADENDDE